jgi:hypothetical protein
LGFFVTILNDSTSCWAIEVWTCFRCRAGNAVALGPHFSNPGQVWIQSWHLRSQKNLSSGASQCSDTDTWEFRRPTPSLLVSGQKNCLLKHGIWPTRTTDSHCWISQSLPRTTEDSVSGPFLKLTALYGFQAMQACYTSHLRNPLRTEESLLWSSPHLGAPKFDGHTEPGSTVAS